MNYFPAIRENSRVILLPESQIIIDLPRKYRASLPKGKKSIGITHDAWIVLKHCDGLNDVNAILKILNREYDITKKYLLRFFQEMERINILTMKKNSNKSEFKICGDGERYFPLHVSFRVTERCNLNCKYCYMGKSDLSAPFTDYSKIEKLLTLMKNNFVNTIEITGGEPMMHPDIFQVLKYSIMNFSFVSILTNGIYFPDHIVEYLTEFKDKVFVQVSVDGSNEEVSSVMRGAKNTSNKTIQTIKKLIQNKISHRIAMVVDFENVFDIENVILNLKAIGVRNITITFSNELGNAEREKESTKTLFLDIFTKHGEYIAEIVERHSDIVNVELNDIEESKFLNSRNCGAGTKTVVINHLGDVYPCPMLNEGAKIMGNILKDDYFNIFNVSELSKICRSFNLDSVKDLSCKGCEYSYYCTSCFSKVYISNKHRAKRNLDMCEVAQKYEVNKIAAI